jgi:hypothetical protein
MPSEFGSSEGATRNNHLSMGNSTSIGVQSRVCFSQTRSISEIDKIPDRLVRSCKSPSKFEVVPKD